MTDKEAILKTIDAEPWISLLALADLMEEEGNLVVARGLRRLVKTKRRPYHHLYAPNEPKGGFVDDEGGHDEEGYYWDEQDKSRRQGDPTYLPIAVWRSDLISRIKTKKDLRCPTGMSKKEWEADLKTPYYTTMKWRGWITFSTLSEAYLAAAEAWGKKLKGK